MCQLLNYIQVQVHFGKVLKLITINKLTTLIISKVDTTNLLIKWQALINK